MFYSPEAYTYGGLFIAFSGTSFLSFFLSFFRLFFFFLLRNVTFCTCAMQLYREGRNSFLLFTWFVKPTASALENAVNKVTLVYLAMLAKIGYLFTRDILFLYFCPFLEWCLISCLWFSIENVKKTNKTNKKKTVPYLWWTSHRSALKCCLSSCWMMGWIFICY